MTGLSPTTTYEVVITGVCADQNLTENSYATFTTTCVAISLDDLPKTWDFESGNTQGTSYTHYPQCWTKILGNISATKSVANSGDSSLYFGSYSQACIALTPLDGQTVNIQDLQLSLYAKVSGTSPGKLIVGAMTDPTDIDTFVALDTINLSSVFTQYEVILNSYQENGKYIVLKTPLNPNSVYVDDVKIELIPTCPKANKIAVSDVTESSATLSWAQKGSTVTSWIVKYRIKGENDWTSINSSTTTANLTNLSSSSTYEVQIEGVCTGGENPISNIFVFTTNCTAIVVTNTTPWEESFADTLALHCWTLGASEWKVLNGKLYHSYKNDLDGKAISPIFNLTAVTTPAVRFSYTLPDDDQEFGQVNTLTVLYRASDTVEWTELKSYTTVSTNEIDTITLPNKSATYQLCFKWSNYFSYANGIQVDNLKIFNNENGGGTPDLCVAPTNLVVGAKTQTTATITWNGNATSYEVQLGDNAAETVVATTKTFTNLTANTSYVAKVRAKCDNNQFSEWVTVNFTTDEETTPDCTKPTGLSVVPSSNSITMSWVGTVASYDVQINNEPVQNTTQTTYTFLNLNPNTTYNVQVRSNCGQTVSEWLSSTVKTSEQVQPTEDPVVITGEATATQTTAILNATVDKKGNEITKSGFKYRKTDATTWTDDVTADITASGLMSKEISGLTANTSYDFMAYVQTNQGKTIQGLVKTFKTKANGLIDVDKMLTVTTYPNPTTDDATLKVSGLTSDAQVMVSDINGRVILNTVYAVDQEYMTIHTDNLPAGVYYIRIMSEDVMRTQTLIKK